MKTRTRTRMVDFERWDSIRHNTMSRCIDEQQRSQICARIAQFQAETAEIAIHWQHEAAEAHQEARIRLERLIGIN